MEEGASHEWQARPAAQPPTSSGLRHTPAASPPTAANYTLYTR